MTELLHLAGGLGAVLVLPWLLFLMGFSVACPFMCISVVKNIARMRRALEQLAETGAPRETSTPGSILRT